MTRKITKEEFDEIVDILWEEIEYQNNLDRRTDEGEAKDIPGFLTLGQVYSNETAAAWANSKGNTEIALSGLRKLASIYIRGMAYAGAVRREQTTLNDNSINIDKNLLYCNFCGKNQHEVNKLIAGPNVNICNECIVTSVEVLSKNHKST